MESATTRTREYSGRAGRVHHGNTVMRSILLMLLLVAAPSSVLAVEGHARIIDGDTLEIESMRVRLAGIDAPEQRQVCWRPEGAWPCGRVARGVLEAMIAGRDVNCTPSGRDRYRRFIAVCRVGSLDLNRAMVAGGWALAYRSISRTYVDAENGAREGARGMWGSVFLPPWAWRRR